MADFYLACEEGNLKKVEQFIQEGYDVNKENDRYLGYKRTSLMCAAGEGRVDVVKYLLRCGADVSKKDNRERTALHYASENGHLEIVETLISEGVEIDVEDKDHRTPLMLAAKSGRNNISLYLIDHGADVIKKNIYKRTALHYASVRGHLQVVDSLISKGAEIDVEDEALCTPLMLAAREGHYRISLLLIDYGAQVDKKDGRKRTALHYASEKGHLKVVKLLHDRGASFEVEDENCSTPLLLAAKHRHVDISTHLINNGADVCKKDGRDRTALHYVSESGPLKLVKLLLSQGAQIDAEDKDLGNPLMLAVEQRHSDISMFLINCGADVKKKDSRKRTALHYASESGNLKVVELLLSKGAAQIDLEDKDHCTPLLLAAGRSHTEISLYLINHSADVNKKDGRNRTALHYASESGHFQVVETLLSKGADIEVQDSNLSTPLLLAAERGHRDILLYLIDQGADVDTKGNLAIEQTALHYVSRNGDLEAVKSLLSKGAKIDIKDKYHHTPLIVAVLYQKFAVMCHLIEAGGNVRLLADFLSHRGDRRNLERIALFHAIDCDNVAAVSALIINCVGIEEELTHRSALMWCAEKGHDSLVRHLILQGVNVNYQVADGSTALHSAARFNHVQCGVLLVEAGANVKLANNAFMTPLEYASREFQDVIIQTLSFNTRKTVCVIGNACGGKSTLIASLQNENANFFKKICHRMFGVKNISKRTAGIEPVSHSSKRYGDVVFFDFAGQHEYHGPHELFLESILSKSGSTVAIILVVKVTEEESVISEQLSRWLHPVSEMSHSTNPIQVIVVGSHMDQVKSKVEAKEKLEQCYAEIGQTLCDAPVEFLDVCYLDCRQPYSNDIHKLCRYLNEVPLPEYKATKMAYSICWVIYRMKTLLESKAIRVADFTKWIEENKADLPTSLPPAKEVCEDLSSTGHFLYLPNKEEPSNGWLVLDLPSILHEVYGTLFSPSKKIVNAFGLLNCEKLTIFFPALNPEMIREVLISLEFCVEMDPSILPKEVIQLTESLEKDHEHLFFPALVSSQPPKVFASAQQGQHVLSWQLAVDRKPFISPRLLQTIILRLVAHHVFHYKRGSHTREHYCSVWSTGIFWQSAKDVDVAVQISDNTIVEVIGRSEIDPEALCLYISTITQDICATIHELSPTLSATAYIIHPSNPQVLLENPRFPSPHRMFPVEAILESKRNRGNTCLSCKTENEPATRKPISDLFCNIVPTEEVVQGLFIASYSQSVMQSPTAKDSVQPLEGKSGSFLATPSNPPTTTPTGLPKAHGHSIQLTPTDPLSDTPIDPLLTTPTLHKLNQLVIRQIALDWYSVGLHLEIEVLALQIIETDIHPPSVERCCRTMFTRWLAHDEGTGGAPRLWRTVLKALKDVGYNTLVGDVERTLFQPN